MGYSMVFVVGYFMVFVMGYKSQSLLIIPHWEDWEKKELKKKKLSALFL